MPQPSDTKPHIPPLMGQEEKIYVDQICVPILFTNLRKQNRAFDTLNQMKQLFIVRHAKSDWGNASLRDFDRPLNHRGHQNAPEMANRLVAKGIRPDAVVSSPALRALTTAKYFAAGWQIPAEQLNTNANIYEASVKTLLKVINDFDTSFDKIALFGHNPGLTDLLNYLTDEHISNMPTCSVAIIEFPLDSWELISGGTGNLVWFDYPKSGLD